MRRYLTKFDAAMRDALAREFGVDPKVLWDVLDGKPGPPRFVKGLLYSMGPLLTEDTLSEPHDDGLPSVADDATIATSMLEQTTRDIRGARPTKNKASDALREAGVSFAELARAMGLPLSTVRSWFQKGSGGRPVPAKHFPALKEYGIKAADLPNGVAEK